ncbi:MAG: 5-oxoprolinase subunit PxpB [Ornithinimicrobium sp.]
MIAATALPIGEEAVLIEVDDIASVLTLHDALQARITDGHAPWEGVIDLVPAAQTVLLIAPEHPDLKALGHAAVDLAANCQTPEAISDSADTSNVVAIAVTYDGEDLDDIAEHTGLTREEIIEAHTGTTWTVAFFGFAPGFAYLAGGDSRLHVPRRDEPRTTVPRGSVGLAGDFSAVYPRSSPGGWQLLGHTDESMWDVEADQPSRLQSGDQVRFVVAES